MELLRLQRATTVTQFIACCLHLEVERSKNNPLRKAIRGLKRKGSLPVFQNANDPRWSLLYFMIQDLLRNDTAKFFDTPSDVQTVGNPLEDPLQASEWVDPFSIDAMIEGAAPKPMAAPIDSEDDEHDAEPLVDHLALFGTLPPTRVHVPAERPSINWNTQQDRAFKAVFTWLKSSNRKPVFRLFGYAGTGKTTMAKEIAWNVEHGESGLSAGDVMFAAFTGKAASVLRSKGCLGAQTIHSLIYRPLIDPVTGVLIGTKINDESPLKYAKLLIVDEVSMVNEEMARDLMSFGVPILVLGDPGQLDPIKGEGYFTQARPDVMLTKVERQAAESPIIWLATRVRLKKSLSVGNYGTSRVTRKDITDTHIEWADMILTGMRNTRAAYNRRVRRVNGLYDIDTQFPVKGDTLMCLRNNKNNGLLNGTLWTASQPELKTIQRLKDFKRPLLGYEPTNIEGLHFRARSNDIFDADGQPLIVNTVCSTHHFDESLPEPNWREIAGTDEWGFGYASTTHKAQGSQWAKGIVIDESFVFSDQAEKHLYTAITRFADAVRIKRS
jgi:exodeoxyribonuclease-5